MNIIALVEDLTVAYFDARRHKRSTYNQLEFELNLEHNLYELASEIWDRCYSPKPSICFIVDKPVKREIFAANYAKPAYILKLDLRGFFMSIKRPLLFSMVEKLVMERYNGDDKDIMLYLIRCIIFNEPTKGCIIKGRKSDWRGLPDTKSLFHARPDCGLPIGNLTSQIFANVYLNGFDHWIKEVKGCKCYGRYVDDFYVVAGDAKALTALVFDVREYLKANLSLTLHPKKIYLEPIWCGVKYLGVYVKPYRRTIVNNTKGNYYESIRKYNELLERCDGEVSNELLFKAQSSFNSYLGIMKHYSTYRLIKRYEVRYLDARWLQWCVAL